MKKIIFVLLTLVVAAQAALAVPALRGKYTYKQPDGSVIVLENHGDEFYHWTTDASGRTVEMGTDGFYRPVDVSAATQRARAARARANARKASWSSYDSPLPTNKGDRKILCLLAEFQPEVQNGEEVFSGKYTVEKPAEHFWDMLNKEGYDEDGAIGSVRDYYLANSMNQYRPSFDVYGPVTLDHSESYYDQNGVHLAILEIYDKLAGNFDINQYDTDGNGELDMVLFYFPGHNEAEHAPSWTIWPHQGSGYYGMMGGKRLVRYFCTSELRGQSGSDPAAIGTTCHEFAHSLGLPDFYDVGAEDHGGENRTLDLTYTYDLMCYGNYNDNGRRPPYLTSLERNMLGWMEMPAAITSSGSHTLQGVQENTAARIDGRMEGEFFLLECRNQGGWDSGTPMAGMVVYQVDQSNRVLASGVTAASLWSTNNINSYGGHPCYRIVPSQAIQYTNDLVFPGRGITTFAPVDWDGLSAGVTLNGIAYGNGQVTFGVSVDDSKTVFGYVKDGKGNPLSGATVVLSHSLYEFAAPPLLPTDQTCETDEDGYYSFTLESSASAYQIVTARAGGYIPQSFNVQASERFAQRDFVLLRPGELPPATLQRYDATQGTAGGGHGSSTSRAVGMKYTAAELRAMNAVGGLLSKISFWCNPDAGSEVYLVVDIGGEMKLRKNVTSEYVAGGFQTFDVSDERIVIPEGKDVFIGYGLTGMASGSFPFMIFGPVSEEHGGSYYLDDFLHQTYWKRIIFGESYYDFAVSAVLSFEAEIDFATLGVSYIKLVNDVPQVVPAAGKTVHDITWTLDGTPINGTPGAVSNLPAGAHTYMARVAHYDGTVERVYFDVNKE